MANKRERNPGELEQALRGVRADKLRSVLTKDARIEIRVTSPEKAEMERAAKACNLTVTEYLTRLHHIAAERLGVKRGRA
jgi:mobilization protein NikA